MTTTDASAEPRGAINPAITPALRATVISACALFQSMRADELDNVFAGSLRQTFPRGATLMAKGEPGTSMAVIIRGRVRISSATDDGREVSIGVLGPGEVLGEISLLDGRARSADVIAMEDGELLVIRRNRFLDMLRGNADLCLRLMVFLCKRLRQANASLEDLALLDLPGRLANLLLRMAREFGRQGPHGTRIELRLSQETLASLIGSSREKVNRQLKLWEKAGIVSMDGRTLILSDTARLVAAGVARER